MLLYPVVPAKRGRLVELSMVTRNMGDLIATAERLFNAMDKVRWEGFVISPWLSICSCLFDWALRITVSASFLRGWRHATACPYSLTSWAQTGSCHFINVPRYLLGPRQRTLSWRKDHDLFIITYGWYKTLTGMSRGVSTLRFSSNSFNSQFLARLYDRGICWEGNQTLSIAYRTQDSIFAFYISDSSLPKIHRAI